MKGSEPDSTHSNFPNKIELQYPTYTYKNSDSVVWLKHFIPIGNTPQIASIVDFKDNPGSQVVLKIQSQQGEFIEAIFGVMRNRIDGMKVHEQDKQRLKTFWGSHGDNREYQVEIIQIIQ